MYGDIVLRRLLHGIFWNQKIDSKPIWDARQVTIKKTTEFVSAHQEHKNLIVIVGKFRRCVR